MQTTTTTTASSEAHRTSTDRTAGGASAVSRVLLLAVLWFVLCWHLSSEWSLNEQYSYGWFVPFFALFLFWLRWEDRPRAFGANVQRPTSDVQRSMEPAGRSTLVFALAVAGALLLLLPIRLFEVGNPDWRPLGWVHAIVVVAVTAIVVWDFGGAAWLRHFAFPIGFILVAVPWLSAVEGPVINGLMSTVAAVAAETLNLLGIPAQLEGSLIRVNTGLVGVNEACSGVRSLQTSLMIGLLFGELKRLSFTHRLFLLGGALAIAILANFGRAFTLVWLSATRSPEVANQWHDGLGYSIVGLVFVGSLVLATWLAKKGERVDAKGESDVSTQESEVSDARPTFRIPRSVFAISIVWLIGVEAAVEGWYRIHERNLMLEPSWTVRWPESAPSFREIEIDEGVSRTLRFDNGREATWAIPQEGTRPMTVFAFFFRWNAGGSSVVRARAHRPDICLPSAGWELIEDHGLQEFAVGRLTVPFRYVTFRQQRGTAVAHTFFCLQEDVRRPTEERPDMQLSAGVQPDWSLPGRARVVRNGVRNLGQQVLEIVLVPAGPMDEATVAREMSAMLETIIVPAAPQQQVVSSSR